MVEKRRVAVVGGGIIGAAVVRELTQRLPGAEIVLFEKEREPAAHQTGTTPVSSTPACTTSPVG